MVYSFIKDNLHALQASIKHWEGVDVSTYSYSYFHICIEDFLEKYKIPTLSDLINKITGSKYWYEKFISFLQVKETEIFRDPTFWQYLRDELLPLFKGNPIKVWFPEVSTGEELYSLLITAKEAGVFDQLEVTGSAANEQQIENIQNGFLTEKNFSHNADNFKRFHGYGLVQDYFTLSETKAYLKTELLKNVKLIPEYFTEHTDSNNYDIICYRNKMLVHNELYKNSALHQLTSFIKTSGYLCIGINETIKNSPSRQEFKDHNLLENIYQKLRIK